MVAKTEIENYPQDASPGIASGYLRFDQLRYGWQGREDAQVLRKDNAGESYSWDFFPANPDFRFKCDL